MSAANGLMRAKTFFRLSCVPEVFFPRAQGIFGVCRRHTRGRNLVYWVGTLIVGYKIASYVFHHEPELVDNLSQQSLQKMVLPTLPKIKSSIALRAGLSKVSLVESGNEAGGNVIIRLNGFYLHYFLITRQLPLILDTAYTQNTPSKKTSNDAKLSNVLCVFLTQQRPFLCLTTSPLRFIVLFWLPDFDSHVTSRGKRENPRSDVTLE